MYTMLLVPRCIILLVVFRCGMEEYGVTSVTMTHLSSTSEADVISVSSVGMEWSIII